MKPECMVLNLGLIDYETAWGLQRELATQIAEGARPPTLLLLEHPHTYTFGRRGRAGNLLWDETELAQRDASVHWVDRGGDVTYHGPGQLVGYPLMPLAPGGLLAGSNGRLPQADFVGYLRSLESVLIRALASLGLASGQIDGLTGVWVQPDVLSRCRHCPPDQRQRPAKIASIGVKVDVRGISRHGFALNVDPDMGYWEGIVACGLADYPAVRLADLVLQPPVMDDVIEAVITAFGDEFGYQMKANAFEANQLIGDINRGAYGN
jgi:lipoate-protein ligase B